MAMPGLCCYVRAFSSCSEQGYSLVTVCGLLFAVASLWSTGSTEHGLQQLQHTGLAAPQHMDLPEPGIELVSPAFAGGLLATGPPGKSSYFLMPLP